ncbi:MAG: hypothetical protein WD023_06450 [Ilumatobacteraceae bacterium]
MTPAAVRRLEANDIFATRMTLLGVALATKVACDDLLVPATCCARPMDRTRGRHAQRVDSAITDD